MNCDDCNTKCLNLKKVQSCSDAHSNPHPDGPDCCFKFICNHFCKYTCTHCFTLNKIDINESHDNFYESFTCWNCSKSNPVTVKFWGDIRENCHRYCKCGVYEIDTFELSGRS